MATMQPRSRIISISALPWEERQPGVKRKLLWEDPTTQRRAIMNRIEPSAQFPRHRHIGDELVFVIEGALSDDFGTVTAGNMSYRPHGCVHTISTKHGATVLFIITGSTEPATERGTAPPSESFALHDLPWVETGPGVRQKWTAYLTLGRAVWRNCGMAYGARALGSRSCRRSRRTGKPSTGG